MKKFLQATLASLLISGAVYSQKPTSSFMINKSLDYLSTVVDAGTNPYIRNKKTFHPLGLYQENIEAIILGDSYSVMSPENSIQDFFQSFLHSDLWDEVPATLDKDDSKGALYWQAKNSMGLYLMHFSHSEEITSNENTILFEFVKKSDTLNKITYIFCHSDNFELKSIELQLSYLPKTVWPEIKLNEDVDNDGMNDYLERYFFNKLDPTADGDFDGDGISNLDEIKMKSDPEQHPRSAMITRSAKVYFQDDELTYQIDRKMVNNYNLFVNKSIGLFCSAAGYYDRRTKQIAKDSAIDK